MRANQLFEAATSVKGQSFTLPHLVTASLDPKDTIPRKHVR
jgi:hypothetical protein